VLSNGQPPGNRKNGPRQTRKSGFFLNFRAQKGIPVDAGQGAEKGEFYTPASTASLVRVEGCIPGNPPARRKNRRFALCRHEKIDNI
jgi:hypothetical protein